MFAGIVKAVGCVSQIDTSGKQYVIGVTAPLLHETAVGESVCVSGVCLTVVARNGSECLFDLATETRRCTSLGDLTIGSNVNLELSLRASELVHGHFVQGHVDAITVVTQITNQENTVRFEFKRPANIADLIVPKGSVSIDGVSLTVGEVVDDTFSVYIIPHTLDETIFSILEIGSSVNIEGDCIARYVRSIVDTYLENRNN